MLARLKQEFVHYILECSHILDYCEDSSKPALHILVTVHRPKQSSPQRCGVSGHISVCPSASVCVITATVTINKRPIHQLSVLL